MKGGTHKRSQTRNELSNVTQSVGADDLLVNNLPPDGEVLQAKELDVSMIDIITLLLSLVSPLFPQFSSQRPSYPSMDGSGDGRTG